MNDAIKKLACDMAAAYPPLTVAEVRLVIMFGRCRECGSPRKSRTDEQGMGFVQRLVCSVDNTHRAD